MACVNKQNPDCPNCNKSGLAILPVRYAVVPNEVDAMLPAGLGNKVTNTKLEHYKYALRTLRQGFLYLYYEKHSRGSHMKWEIYAVSRAGTLWKQTSKHAFASIGDDPTCSRSGHNIPASFITIENPARCGRVWMAFSEHAWSAETIKLFEHNAETRDRRMQTFSPQKWLQTSGYRHGVVASLDNLNQIIEYKSGFRLSSLGKGAVEEISKLDGSFELAHLERQTTRYPICVRRDEKQTVLDTMQYACEMSTGKANHPAVIALWDNVGIAHELCGFRNDAAARCEMYGKERALEIGAMHDIDGLKVALEDSAAKRARRISEAEIVKWNNATSQKRIHDYKIKHPGDENGIARQKDLCRRLELDAIQRAPSRIVVRRQLYTGLDEVAWKAKMAEIDKEVDRSNRHMNANGKSTTEMRDEQIWKWERRAATDIWAKYASHVNVEALSAFRMNHASFYSKAETIINARTDDLLKWIESKSILDALTEFHVDSLEDGVAFENTIADMIFGINSSPRGALRIESWVRENKVSESNLIWRAFALNHSEMTTELDGVLGGVAAAHDVTFTEASLAAASGTLKHIAKFGDLSKKALTLHNTLRKAGVKQVQTRGVEKLYLTIGNKFFDTSILRKGTEWLSEKFIAGLLLAKASCESALIVKLLESEAKDGIQGRHRALQMLGAAQTLFVSKRHKELTEIWEKLAKTSDIPKENPDPKLAGSFNEAKELRFGIVIVLLQGLLAWKLSVDAKKSPENERIAAELLMVRLSLVAAIIDLFSTAIKGLHDAKDASLGFQALKLSGGVFSTWAGGITAALDFDMASVELRKSNYAIANLYRLKGTANGASSGCFAFALLSYANPTAEV